KLVDLNGVERHQHERDKSDTEHDGGDSDVTYQRPRRKRSHERHEQSGVPVREQMPSHEFSKLPRGVAPPPHPEYSCHEFHQTSGYYKISGQHPKVLTHFIS